MELNNNDLKVFLEFNIDLLERDFVKFFSRAANVLSIPNQINLIKVLADANIEFEQAREQAINLIIANHIADIQIPIYLDTFIDRQLDGILGYDASDIRTHILENTENYDIDIVLKHDDYKLYPRI